LLTIASALKTLISAPNLTELYQDLCHETKAFENKAQTYNYRSHLILAARYALCTLIDEIILSTAWGNKSDWKNQNLLGTFQGETWGGERFFVILERSSEDPALYIDLLELMYICLNLGFEGKYHQIERGHQQLTVIMDNLFRLIMQQRGEFSKKLFLRPNLIPEKKSTNRLMPIWLVAIMMVMLLSIIYGGFNYYLNKNTASTVEELKEITAVPAES
jgi:type IV/VI secretion system ImpK/VasF family protein